MCVDWLGMSKRCNFVVAGLGAAVSLFAMAFSPAVAEDSDATRSDQVVASITYNFARFIQWRDQGAKSANENFSICIIDRDASSAWSSLEGKTVGAQKVKLLYQNDITEIGQQCDLAYVSTDQLKYYSLRDLAKNGVVTISDAAKFNVNGGAIELSVADSRATFEINEQVLARAGARISSKLMRVGMRLSVDS